MVLPSQSRLWKKGDKEEYKERTVKWEELTAKRRGRGGKEENTKSSVVTTQQTLSQEPAVIRLLFFLLRLDSSSRRHFHPTPKFANREGPSLTRICVYFLLSVIPHRSSSFFFPRPNCKRPKFESSPAQPNPDRWWWWVGWKWRRLPFSHSLPPSVPPFPSLPSHDITLLLPPPKPETTNALQIRAPVLQQTANSQIPDSNL